MRGLEFHVDLGNRVDVFRSLSRAAEAALTRSLSVGTDVNIDVVCWSEAAARAWGGDDGVTTYREDPDASVHERITIRAASAGRVP